VLVVVEVEVLVEVVPPTTVVLVEEDVDDVWARAGAPRPRTSEMLAMAAMARAAREGIDSASVALRAKLSSESGRRVTPPPSERAGSRTRAARRAP